MDVCVVCCKKRQKLKMENNHDKERRTAEVQTHNKRIKKFPAESIKFFTELNLPWGVKAAGA
jgi:hypothetical protein